jgi:hypothetical protein
MRMFTGKDSAPPALVTAYRKPPTGLPRGVLPSWRGVTLFAKVHTPLAAAHATLGDSSKKRLAQVSPAAAVAPFAPQLVLAV